MLCNIHFYKHYAERLTAEVGAWERMNIPIIAINWAGNHKIVEDQSTQSCLTLRDMYLTAGFWGNQQISALRYPFFKNGCKFRAFYSFFKFLFPHV